MNPPDQLNVFAPLAEVGLKRSEPLVSVSMPAFNTEKYISEAIESVLSQTYTNFELIIVDDGSTDKTRDIINRYSDPRIIKIFSDQNHGLISTRNKIASLAKGKYLALLDADDRALPDRLKIQVEFLETHDVDICGADHWTLNQNNGDLRNSKQRHSNADIHAMLTVCSPLCNPAVMGKTVIFKSHPYKLTSLHAEDYFFWAELALAGYRFANIPNKLIIYRLHASQTSINFREEAKNVFKKSQAHYLSGLGIPVTFLPRVLSLAERLNFGVECLRLLNQKIPGISVGANYEIYARFQHRKNGILTPLTRLERLLIALSASWIGRKASEN